MKQLTLALPPRKWYSLEQATKRIHALTGEALEIADLLHQWHLGTLNLSIYFLNYPALIGVGNVEFWDKSKIWLDIHKDREEDYELEDIFEQRHAPQTKCSNEFTQHQIIKAPKTKHRDFISGFMNVACTSGLRNPQEERQFIQQGILLNSYNYLLSPSEIKDRKTVIQFSALIEEDLFLAIDNLVVLDYDLMQFLQGKTEKTDPEAEIKKIEAGRPKDPRLEEILDLGRRTFREYPQASANKIASEVRKYLIERDQLKDNQIIKQNRILEYYRDEGIGATGKAQNKKLKICVINE